MEPKLEFDAEESEVNFEDDPDDRDYEPSEVVQLCKSLQDKHKIWSNSETRILIEYYKRLIPEVGKRLTHKKDMWIEISTHIPNKDAKQCEQRFNTVLKRKKKGQKSGDATELNYGAKLNGILKRSKMPNRTKERTLHTNNKKKIIPINKSKKNIPSNDLEKMIPLNNHEKMITLNNSENGAADDHIKDESLTIQQTLLQILAKKEEAKQRRHSEKMEAMKKIQNILQKILDCKTRQLS